MSLQAELRIGSLEILGALALFAVVAGRVRPRLRPVSPPLAVSLRIAEAAAGGSEGRTVALTLTPSAPAVLIGRSSEAGVSLTDPEVSRRHARLEISEGVLYLSDLGSSNGTFLNGNPVKNEGIEVRPGDDIDVGNTRISVMGAAPVSWT